MFDVVERRVDALFEESLPAPDVPATPPRSPLREKAAALSPEIEKVVVEAEAMEREAQVKEELAEKLKLEVEELATRAKEAEERSVRCPRRGGMRLRPSRGCQGPRRRSAGGSSRRGGNGGGVCRRRRRRRRLRSGDCSGMHGMPSSRVTWPSWTSATVVPRRF